MWQAGPGPDLAARGAGAPAGLAAERAVGQRGGSRSGAGRGAAAAAVPRGGGIAAAPPPTQRRQRPATGPGGPPPPALCLLLPGPLLSRQGCQHTPRSTPSSQPGKFSNRCTIILSGWIVWNSTRGSTRRWEIPSTKGSWKFDLTTVDNKVISVTAGGIRTSFRNTGRMLLLDIWSRLLQLAWQGKSPAIVCGKIITTTYSAASGIRGPSWRRPPDVTPSPAASRLW